jgi:heme/copper-type cytochrome/quinol oxidase subunit 2
MTHPRNWTRGVIICWAVLMIVVGMSMVLMEGFVHYRHYLSRHAAVESPWTIVPFIVGSLLATFGGLILQKGDVSSSVGTIRDLAPYVAELLASVRSGGQRKTDPAAPPSVAKDIDVPPSGTPQ